MFDLLISRTFGIDLLAGAFGGVIVRLSRAVSTDDGAGVRADPTNGYSAGRG